MNIKKYLVAVGLAGLVTVSAIPLRVCAEETVKSEKALDAAPAATVAATADLKARDVAPPDYAEGYLAQRLGAMQQSTKLAGAMVEDREQRSLGKVEGLLLDVSSGKVYGAVVSLGANSRVVVPGRSFFPADNKKVILDMKKEFLEGAPRLNTADWEAASLRRFIDDSYVYFGQKPLWMGKTGPEHINRSSDFIGMEVIDKNNQSLGRMTEFMVDLPTARLVFAVISLDGSKANVYAVPPAALTLTSDKKALFLDEDKAKITPRMGHDDYFWTEMTDRIWAARTYRTYGIQPDFDTESNQAADATHEQVRAKADDAPAPSNSVAGKSDSDINRSVLVALVREDMDTAFGHKNIKINTVNGGLTLMGHVKNEKVKNKLGAIAESVAGAGNVDNQLLAR